MNLFIRQVRHSHSPTPFRLFAALVAVFATLLLLQPLASSQSQFATLSGTVTDSSGAVVSGAAVTVKPSHSQDVRKTVTNTDGFFSMPALPAGTYEVSVAMNGFQKWHGTDIVLNASDSRTMKIELKVGSIAETVEVKGTVTELATIDSGEKSALISSDDLQHLSLVGRNATEYLKILPGSTLGNNYSGNSLADSGQTVQMGQSPVSLQGQLGNVNINGQTADITQDGQRIADTGKGTFTPVNQNPEMISEMKVLTSNFSAENAKGPVVVNTETKGGTSDFHGSVYMYARNSAMNATEHHNIVSNAPEPKPPSSYYYPGGNIGGPIPKTHKKLFFFDGFEYYKQQLDAGLSRAWVPTPDMLNGDFSFLSTYTGPKSLDLYNVPTAPAAGAFVGYDIRSAAGCTITGGVLAQACISPAAQIFLKDTIPTANVDPAANSGFNFIQTYSEPDNSWQNVTREDWNISDNTKVYVTYSHEQESQQWPAGLWVTAGDDTVPTPSPITGKNKSDVFNGTFVHVFSPTMTLEVRGGFMKSSLISAPVNLNKFTRSGTGYPLTGVMSDTNIPSVSSWTNSVPNLGDVGYDYHPRVVDNQGTPSMSANLTKVVKTHTMKAGFYYEHAYNNQDNWQQYQGTYQYADWGPQATGNEWSDMLMGIGMQGYYQQGPPVVVNVAQNIASFHVQDDWKVNRRLTVNYGLRFEHYPKPYNSQYGMAVFNPANYNPNAPANVNTGVSWHAIDSSVPSTGSTVPLFFYSPRVGGAFDVFGNSKTVIRGGFGKYRAFDPFQSRNYTDPAGTAMGVVAWGNCGSFNSAYCPTWESLDQYAFTPVLGKSLLQGTPFTVDDQNNHETPLVDAYSFTIDQSLPSKFKAEVSYVGNEGKFIETSANANSVPFGTLNTTPPPPCPGTFHVTDPQCQQLYRPYQLYQGITEVRPLFKSRFDSFQASLIRYSGWLTLQANYTFSKSLADNNLSEGALADWGTSELYGYSVQNRKNTLSMAYVFALPKTHSANSFVRGAVDNWQISGITQISSGAQLNAQSANFNYSGGNPVTLAGSPDVTLTPLITCNPRSNLGKHQYMNPNCFTNPTAAGGVGTLGTPLISGPLYWNSDLTLLKDFKIGERQSLQFRFAAFNFLNAALLSFNGNYTDRDANLTATFNNLGQMITGTNCPGTTTSANPCTVPSTFGTADTYYGHRILELGVKYTF